uniref:Uncharacterized protein n=1 Tax=Cajanus cajan TaxID=3821 RepID=A0A151SCP2_CAJCA|nr:hypothetical protein KK1_025501 [Cajanus cajan]
MSSPGYDPNRIPSSVFANRSTSPMEWSVASNESLFSIHLGNNSFSRDYAFPHNKSGELPRTNDGVIIPSTLPPVQEVKASGNNMDVERHSVSSDSSKTSANVGTNEIVLGKTPEDHHKEEKVPNEEPKNYNSVSYRSVGSDMSTHSFQFPM